MIVSMKLRERELERAVREYIARRFVVKSGLGITFEVATRPSPRLKGDPITMPVAIVMWPGEIVKKRKQRLKLV